MNSKRSDESAFGSNASILPASSRKNLYGFLSRQWAINSLCKCVLTEASRLASADLSASSRWRRRSIAGLRTRFPGAFRPEATRSRSIFAGHDCGCVPGLPDCAPAGAAMEFVKADHAGCCVSFLGGQSVLAESAARRRSFNDIAIGTIRPRCFPGDRRLAAKPRRTAPCAKPRSE